MNGAQVSGEVLIVELQNPLPSDPQADQKIATLEKEILKSSFATASDSDGADFNSEKVQRIQRLAVELLLDFSYGTMLVS